MTVAATAATPILNFDFNEISTDVVKDSVNNLAGAPANAANPPTSVTDSPSGQAGDRAIHFESGQDIRVEDPDMKMALNQDDPSFTLQAWVKFDGNPSGRQVFFYNNGPGGAISFSVNTDRTVFVTTLGILDANSSAAIPDDGKWHHIAVVHENGKELRYYVDGVLGDTRDYTSGVIFTRTQNYFHLGAEPGGGLQFVGSLDRLKVTSGILTPEQLDSKPSTVAAKDTDNDGMPDDWEVQYGFNPNDPSDAAKDFDGDGVSNLDEFKAGTDPIDVTKPTLVSAVSNSGFDTVTLTFSEALDEATATAAANYTITPSLAVTAATYKAKVVTLTTAKQTAGGTAYTVAVKGVKDTSKNEVAAGTQATFFSYIMVKNGALKFSYWKTTTDGTAVQILYDDPRYPASPDMIGAVYSFNSRDIFPDDSHEQFGATIEGYLTPAVSGDYRFFIYSDDASQLFISTDDKEANLYQIAEETGCCNNFTEPDSPRTSEPIALVAGKKYFVRLVYKEGGGGDYGQVAWRKEGDTTAAGSLRPIPSQFLSSAVDLPAPAEGGFVTQSPAPKATKVSPGAGINIVHRDGKSAWTAANVTLKLDGAAVSPTFTKDGTVATIVYQPADIFASKSTHTVSLTYPDPAGQAATLEWSFEASEYKGPAKDVLHGYNALVVGNGVQTDDKGGFSGSAGDRAIDMTAKGGPVQVIDSAFLAAVNAATTADELSVSMWIKKYDIADSSAIWFSSPTQTRVFQAHTPWSNNSIYFDTAGCCDGTTQRITAGIDTFAGYSGDVSWWNQWRLYVFTKKADAKQIWIDGELFLEGSSSGTLSTDINQFMIGAENSGANPMHALVDDVAVYGKALTQANVQALKSGTKPSALPAATGILAYWDFNATLPVGPAVSHNIAWVSFHPADDTPAADAKTAGFTKATDVGYTDLLKSAGHKVTRIVTSGTPDTALLNTFDLVIISRSVPSGDYQDPPETLAWNGVKTPTMLLGGYILRNSRLGYTTGATIPDTTNLVVSLTAKNPAHAIFAGISLNAGGTMVNGYANRMTYTNALQQGISVNTDPVAGNGTILATVANAGDPAVNGMVIGEWQAGAKLGNAAGDILGGHRLVFLTGSREAGITSQGAGIYDLTTDGSKMFLNAVNYMAQSPGPQFTSIKKTTDGKVTIEWSGGGTLQGAPTVNGPWVDITGAASPYTFAPTEPATFGRIKK